MNKFTNRKRGVRTTAIHAGEAIDPVSRASSPNLVMSSTFAPTEVAGFSARNRQGYEGFVYARLSSPTVKQLEDKLAALEEAQSCQCYASGMAASSALMLGRLSQGDHLVISDTNYVGTAELVRDTLPRFGIEVTPVDMSDLDMVEGAIRPQTRMLWVETPANPIMRLADIEALSLLARAKKVRDVVVDSTFASPIATRPLQLGADFVIHSLTKYIGGHGDAMGGAVLGRKADLDALNLEATVHFGGVLSPFNAWLILRGAATLPIRMRAHEETALAVARFLEGHKSVKRVFYPGLQSHPQHGLARRQMTNFSGMMTLQVADGLALAKRMVEKLEVVHYAVSLGHHRSLIYWIPTADLMRSTFRHEGELLKRYRDFAGDGVFRFSVGLEDAEDICADLERVL
ncbi:MAG: PLP-dependent transferase [Alphaproteobacteria bacterium]|nr:MAG: PLP-dependent transferase [Alphaproteobacteria bacterium]